MITTDRSFLVGTYIILINNYVAILGVVFATIWTTGSHWTRSNFGSTGSTWNQDERLDSSGYNSSGSSGRRMPGFRVHLTSKKPKKAKEDDSTGMTVSEQLDSGSSPIELGTVRLDDGESSSSYKASPDRSF